MTGPGSVPAALEPGVWGVLPTPFGGDDLHVDHDSLTREVAFYRERDATGLVALGVFGEAARLDADEQAAVVATVTAAAGDLPVVVGLPAQSTAPAVEQARRVADAATGPLAGIMVQVNLTDPDRLAAHLDAIHDATGAGIVVQDYPLVSGVRITSAALVDTVRRCAAVVAVKSESPPTCVAVTELVPNVDVPVFGGLGGVGLLDELAAGSAGAMTGFSHPEGLWAAIRAYRNDGFDAARAAYAPWLPLANFEGQPGIGLALRKEILRRRGVIAEASVRAPSRRLPSVLTPLIDRHVRTVPVSEVA